jgi:hypothetical protein
MKIYIILIALFLPLNCFSSEFKKIIPHGIIFLSGLYMTMDGSQQIKIEEKIDTYEKMILTSYTNQGKYNYKYHNKSDTLVIVGLALIGFSLISVSKFLFYDVEKKEIYAQVKF